MIMFKCALQYIEQCYRHDKTYLKNCRIKNCSIPFSWNTHCTVTNKIELFLVLQMFEADGSIMIFWQSLGSTPDGGKNSHGNCFITRPRPKARGRVLKCRPFFFRLADFAL